ncbi:dihydroxyacetone kinase subunit DhaK [Citrobacter freundii]|nr:dihydroxyacetone kinase subunit DhaK [Citrobacter freundii]SUX75425.1 dihydroxyacetone kinase subunit DhaK [Citrobacter freundii]
MKKLINQIDSVVSEQMEGLVASSPHLQANYVPRYIWCKQKENAVALVSGGGAGHEPLHTGFVGTGMLTGACPGEIFTSPTPDQMIECARTVNNGAGVLFFIKNYTGDILNFETAVEMLHDEGISVGTVIIDDDVAVKDSLYTAGRRGVAGTLFVEKIVGAAALQGYSLEKCEQLGREVNNATRSFGIALSACTVPAAGKPSFELAENEIEFGVGIHGEPGIERCVLQNLNVLVNNIMAQLLDNTPWRRTLRHWDRHAEGWIETSTTNSVFDNNGEYIVLINGLGSTPVSELYGVAKVFMRAAQRQGLTITRQLVGNYCTSLDMAGFSISLLKCTPEFLQFWDAPVNTPALRWGC